MSISTIRTVVWVHHGSPLEWEYPRKKDRGSPRRVTGLGGSAVSRPSRTDIKVVRPEDSCRVPFSRLSPGPPWVSSVGPRGGRFLKKETTEPSSRYSLLLLCPLDRSWGVRRWKIGRKGNRPGVKRVNILLLPLSPTDSGGTHGLSEWRIREPLPKWWVGRYCVLECMDVSPETSFLSFGELRVASD